MSDVQNPDINKHFKAVDKSGLGKINGKELAQALLLSQGLSLSTDCCNQLIDMVDQEKTQLVGINEFALIHKYVNYWIATFKANQEELDVGIEEDDLKSTFTMMGYNFSSAFANKLIHKYDPMNNKCISLGQFIETCVKIQMLVDYFQMLGVDKNQMLSCEFQRYLDNIMNV